MVGATNWDRVGNYLEMEIELTRELGLVNFSSCSRRSELLHTLVASSEVPDKQRDSQSAYLIASLILAGKECSAEVFANSQSDLSLPTINFSRHFRITEMYGNHLRDLLGNEQGLVLWMLSAMDPAALIPPPTLECDCQISRDQGRDILLALWRQRIEH